MRKLILLGLLLLPMLSHGQIIVDNFENWTANSISPWNSRTVIEPGTVSTTTGKAYSGTYGLKVDDNTTATDIGFFISRILTRNTTHYMREYVYFPTTFFSSMSVNNYRSIFMMSYSTRTTPSAGGYPIILSVARNGSGNNQIRLQIAQTWESYSAPSQLITGSTFLNENQWYCIELCVPPSSGTLVQWWIDGVEQSTGTLSSPDMINWDGANFGFGWYMSSFFTAYQQIFYMDSIYIQWGDGPIGQERAKRRGYPRVNGVGGSLTRVPPRQSRFFLNDDFENWTINSVSPWTSRTLHDTTAMDISTTTERAHLGSYGLKADDGSTVGAWDFLAKNLNENTTYYVRFYTYFPDTYFSSFTAGQYRSIYMVSTDTAPASDDCFHMVISAGKNGSGVNKLRMQITNNEQEYQSQSVNMNYNGTINENQWYSVEFMIPSSSGTQARWWVDDVEQSSGTYYNITGMTKWMSVVCGFGYYGYIPGYANRQTLYFDDVAVTSGTIGGWYDHIGPAVTP